MCCDDSNLLHGAAWYLIYATFVFQGGSDGKKGRNLLLRNDGVTINLGAKQSYNVRPGVSTSCFLCPMMTCAFTIGSLRQGL